MSPGAIEAEAVVGIVVDVSFKAVLSNRGGAPFDRSKAAQLPVNAEDFVFL
jgi:hypothetical protein